MTTAAQNLEERMQNIESRTKIKVKWIARTALLRIHRGDIGFQTPMKKVSWMPDEILRAMEEWRKYKTENE